MKKYLIKVVGYTWDLSKTGPVVYATDDFTKACHWIRDNTLHCTSGERDDCPFGTWWLPGGAIVTIIDTEEGDK